MTPKEDFCKKHPIFDLKILFCGSLNLKPDKTCISLLLDSGSISDKFKNCSAVLCGVVQHFGALCDCCQVTGCY